MHKFYWEGTNRANMRYYGTQAVALKNEAAAIAKIRKYHPYLLEVRVRFLNFNHF